MPPAARLLLPPMGAAFTCSIWTNCRGPLPLRGLVRPRDPGPDFQGTKGQRSNLGSGFRYDPRKEIRITKEYSAIQQHPFQVDVQRNSFRLAAALHEKRATCEIGSFKKIQTFRVIPLGISCSTTV